MSPTRDLLQRVAHRPYRLNPERVAHFDDRGYHVLKNRGHQHPSREGFPWNISDELHGEISSSDEEEFRVALSGHSPSSYCSAGSVATKPKRRVF